MLAPMRPRPIIPNCMCELSLVTDVRARAPSRVPPLLAVAPDQIVGGAVMLQFRLVGALELWNDALGERLAQFDAPLVEAIDAPDRALGEDAVLVQRDQLAQRGRSQAIQQNRVRRSVAFEKPVDRKSTRLNSSHL